jgi:hypothetical protein
MAIEPRSGLNGETAVPVASIYEATTTQKFALGTEYKTQDGRKFRYTKAGAVALVNSYMCQAQVEIAHHKEIAIGTAAAVGATSLLLSTTLSTEVTKDQYKDGYVMVNKGTGLGQCYRIKSHTTGTTITIELFDAVAVAIANTAEVTLKANPWNGVLVAATTQTGIPVGVPLCPIAAASFGWLQTVGPAPVVVDTGDTVILGAPVGKPGTAAVAGACGVVTNDGTDNVYGNCMTVGAADETALVFLNLE